MQDHFGILKVGPWLTFAMREAIFALGYIEREWLSGRNAQVSDVPGALESAMEKNSEYWKAYYHGSDAEINFARKYSLSDRCRYYWGDSEVQKQVDVMLRNLSAETIPLSLLSHFMPLQYENVRSGLLSSHPEQLIKDKIRHVCRQYAGATGY